MKGLVVPLHVPSPEAEAKAARALGRFIAHQLACHVYDAEQIGRMLDRAADHDAGDDPSIYAAGCAELASILDRLGAKTQ